MNSLPHIGTHLEEEHLNLLNAFSKSCRHSIIRMVKNSQSGHPGGSLSCLDFLTILYAFIIGQTGEDVVVSNGHISPGVYSTLAEMGYIPKEEMIETFRKIGSVYEGHVTRHVDGISYGTGPLGIGASVMTAFAKAEKMKNTNKKVYGLIGDGEAQEGQVYEAINYAGEHNLNNLILFVDYNKVQLTDSLEEILDIDLKGHFTAAKWEVIEVDGHDYRALWDALSRAHQSINKPVVLLADTIMGKGVDFMEETGKKHQADWHGKAPSPEKADEVLPSLEPTAEQQELLENFRNNHISWTPSPSVFRGNLEKNNAIDLGEPNILEAGSVSDCRGAYGKALLDLAKRNSNVVALCADLRGSVKTDGVANELPDQHIEVGIAEQNMVSMAGGMSLHGFVPFCSTFGAFMSSRAKDQARVNDINQTNVKMVATHCGLSVGEDGPTHQAIDDMGSFLGMYHTNIIEPACPNQCDHIIRYVAGHYGNFYVRMGRHKFPVVLKEDGSVFYDKNYKYQYGKTDIIREGLHVTVVATGACVNEAIQARDAIKEKNPDILVEIVAASSIKHFDQTLIDSIRKTQKVITVEDHNTYSGLGGQVARLIASEGLKVDAFKMIGVEEYQLSGTAEQLYKAGGIDAEAIEKAINEIV